jgi:hypothetical protein
VVERVDALRLGFRVCVDDQLDRGIGRHLVAKLVHRPEFPGRVDVKQREWQWGRVKGLAARCSITAESLPIE